MLPFLKSIPMTASMAMYLIQLLYIEDREPYYQRYKMYLIRVIF